MVAYKPSTDKKEQDDRNCKIAGPQMTPDQDRKPGFPKTLFRGRVVKVMGIQREDRQTPLC
jgi:hypothetical protein